MTTETENEFIDVSRILEPGSVAVIGASDRPGNFGGATVQRLCRFGFKGPVWPVNRAGGMVAGIEASRTISDLPEVPDLAVFAVPADALYNAISDCVAHGTRAGIAFAGGLGEAGGQGAVLQDAIVDLCRQSGFALCGPNCVGVINTALPATPTFASALEEIDKLEAGGISMVTQSGGIGTTSFSLGLKAGFPFRHLISSGNEAVVDFSDYLYALARDEGTTVIAGYLEGLKNGPKFIAALAEARRNGKPVVLIKAGATGASARAALAHTGALVGQDRVFDAVFREMGVVRVHSFEELVDAAALLAGTPAGSSFGPGVGIVTFGGGNGVLAADQCAKEGLATPSLDENCVARLRPLLASVATAANPIDLTPTTAFRDEFLSQLPAALGVLADQPNIDELMIIVGTLAARADEIIDVTTQFVGQSPKPVCVSWPSPPLGLQEKLAAHHIYTFLDPADAARAIGRLAMRSYSRPAGEKRNGLLASGFSWEAQMPKASARLIVPEHQCHDVLRAAGLPVAQGGLARDARNAGEIAATVGYPVVLKAASASVTHRAAAGLVVLNARNADEVTHAFRTLSERAAASAIDLDGIYVQTMHEEGVELLVSAFNDPLFGPMVSCGSGGGLTELIDDVVTARAPVGIETADGMIESLKIRPHAKDAYGPLPTEAPTRFVAQLSEMAAAAPWKQFVIEVNPIIWGREGVVAVDGLIIIEEV